MKTNHYFLLLGGIMIFLAMTFSFSLMGMLHYGAGMMDVFYCFGIGILGVVLLGYLLDYLCYKHVETLEIKHYLILAFYLTAALLITLKATFFRGSISPWNGQVFF